MALTEGAPLASQPAMTAQTVVRRREETTIYTHHDIDKCLNERPRKI